MHKFLIDANLPYRFSLWKGEDFIHQFDINPSETDDRIWEFAQRNDLTIITKDADFSERILFSNPPPRIIHIRIGNMRIQEMHKYLNKIWKDIINHSMNYKLTNVYKDRIEGIS